MAKEKPSAGITPLTRATKAKIIAALGEELKKVGFPQHGEKIVQAALTGRGASDKELLLSAILGSTSFKILDELLNKMPEPRAEELPEIIEEFAKVPRQMKTPLAAFAKRLPHPPGGAPRKFKTLAEQREACAEIGEYLGRGYKLRQAQLRVAKSKKVSLRTVQRAWQDNQKAITKRDPHGAP